MLVVVDGAGHNDLRIHGEEQIREAFLEFVELYCGDKD